MPYAAAPPRRLVPSPTVTLIAGRYRLDTLLGQGGTGEVWRAYDNRLERPVALKVLHARVARDEEARIRLRREADALARLRHPNIVGLLDVDEHAERPFIVQEFLPGGTLSGLAATGPHPWSVVRPIALGIARALEHAHAAGVVHRDLKPSNVLFGSDGHVFVADFGLARLLASDESSITTTGTRLGSPEYWAPEQAAGQAASEKADIYALGVLVFQLLTGQLPFAGEDRLAAGYRRVHEDAPRVRDVVPDIAPPIDDMVARLMLRDPVGRPRAADVVRVLESERAARVEHGDETAIVGAAPTARIDAPRADATIAPPTERLVAPTQLRDPAPPAGAAPAAQPPAPAGRPGVRPAAAIIGLVLLALGAALAALIDQDVDAVVVRRDGVAVADELSKEDAIASLALLGGLGLAAIGLLVLVTWAVRGSGRARGRFGRALLAIVGVALAALTAAVLVWTAYGVATASPSVLWDVATR